MEGLPTETLILPLLPSLSKKGREHKEAVAAVIKQVLDSYTSAYAFTFENMRNQRFKEFREQYKSGSRIEQSDANLAGAVGGGYWSIV